MAVRISLLAIVAIVLLVVFGVMYARNEEDRRLLRAATLERLKSESKLRDEEFKKQSIQRETELYKKILAQ